LATRSPLINVMVAAAQVAGRKLRRDFGEVENLQVSKKGPADFVSVADKTAEKTLVEELRKARPKFGFLLEEGGPIEGADTSNTWIVDPLDGTTNFLHGIPHFAISIALQRDNDIEAGVVYEPVTDALYWAEKGKGAYLNNRRMRVAARRDLSSCIFATGIPFMGAGEPESFVAELGPVMAQTAGVRRFGVASLDMAYVAAGRFDGYWERGIHPWDVAAGIALVREAGGVVRTIEGTGSPVYSKSIIAASPALIEPLSGLIGGGRAGAAKARTA
jgi:myo-inositol-1(or 4)-monophosphatase